MAFSIALLNTSLPRHECRKYLAIFAASTPLGVIATYFLLSFLGFADNTQLAGSGLLVSVSIQVVMGILSCQLRHGKPVVLVFLSSASFVSTMALINVYNLRRVELFYTSPRSCNPCRINPIPRT